jgi:hypothetical protein
MKWIYKGLQMVNYQFIDTRYTKYQIDSPIEKTQGHSKSFTLSVQNIMNTCSFNDIDW